MTSGDLEGLNSRGLSTAAAVICPAQPATYGQLPDRDPGIHEIPFVPSADLLCPGLAETELLPVRCPCQKLEQIHLHSLQIAWGVSSPSSHSPNLHPALIQPAEVAGIRP